MRVGRASAQQQLDLTRTKKMSGNNWFDFGKYKKYTQTYLGLAVLGFAASLFMIEADAKNIAVDAVATIVWTALWAYILEQIPDTYTYAPWIIALTWPIIWTFISVKGINYYFGQQSAFLSSSF